jgi:hypothetical protein
MTVSIIGLVGVAAELMTAATSRFDAVLARQELLVAAPPAEPGASGAATFFFVRESHISFCALMNSR